MNKNRNQETVDTTEGKLIEIAEATKGTKSSIFGGGDGGSGLTFGL